MTATVEVAAQLSRDIEASFAGGQKLRFRQGRYGEMTAEQVLNASQLAWKLFAHSRAHLLRNPHWLRKCKIGPAQTLKTKG